MSTKQNKELLLEQLRQTPIIEVACKKTTIGRTSYYRWRSEDLEFAKAADQAIQDGVALVNDAAESQLISAIKDGNLTAVIFWLKNNHSNYKQPLFQSGLSIAKDDQENLYLEIFGKLKPETEKLIESQLKVINKDHEGPKQTQKTSPDAGFNL